jgi:hypothetical protein
VTRLRWPLARLTSLTVVRTVAAPCQRDALDRGGRSPVGREEVSPERAVDLCEDDVTKAGARLGVELDFLTGEGALGGSPDAGRGGVVVCEVGLPVDKIRPSGLRWETSSLVEGLAGVSVSSVRIMAFLAGVRGKIAA